MSDAIATGQAAIELRKERVHTTMLIELLALLIFLAMAFAFVLQEEGDRANPWREKYDKARAELVIAQKQRLELEKQLRAARIRIESLAQSLARFIAANNKSLPANDQVVLSKTELERLSARLANAEAVIREQTNDNAALRSRMNGGVDLPPCTVTAGPLLRFELLADGRFRTEAAWTPGAADRAKSVPGVLALTQAGPVPRGILLQNTRRIQAWAKAQQPQCQFRVRAHAGHNDAGLFNRQIGDLEQTFYVSRRIGSGRP